jgi:hypothetical protein
MLRIKALSEAIVDGVYFERNPTTLTPDHVDPQLWEVVQAINQTRWAWTRYCCEGHWDHESESYRCDPYLQVVCHQQHLDRVLSAASVAMASSFSLRPELHVSLSTEPASIHWISCTLHALDIGETAEQTLPAARKIVQQFGRLLADN